MPSRWAEAMRKRQEAGLCRKCGKAPPEADRLNCAPCAKREALYAKAKRGKRIKKGVCPLCPAGADTPLAPGEKRCPKCAANQAAWQKDWRDRQAAKKSST